jgi:hypothetical protein
MKYIEAGKLQTKYKFDVKNNEYKTIRRMKMGDWRSVNIKGKVTDKEKVKEIRDYLKYNSKTYGSKAEKDGIYYLQFGEGLCGLNEWIDYDGNIDALGNVFERDCENSDLLKELTILAEKYPCIDLVLHSGDNYESLICTASFVVKDGIVKQEPPMIDELEKMSNDKMQANLYKALLGF